MDDNRKEQMREQAREYLVSRGLLRKNAITINAMDVDIDPLDRISQLPDQVLFYLTGKFLPSKFDLVSLSEVSRTWYRVLNLKNRYSIFKEVSFGISQSSEPMMDRAQKFKTFVQNTLLKRCYHNKKISRFCLHVSMSLVHSVYSASAVEHWIELALHFFGVRNLDLFFRNGWSYRLPQIIFCAKELNVLFLRQFRIMKSPQGQNPMISWPSLRELNLQDVYIDEEIMDSLIFICPLIEKFVLYWCSGFKRIQLSGFAKLRKVVVYDIGAIERITIDSVSLKSFSHLLRGKDFFQKLDLRACKNMEELVLREYTFSTADTPIYMFPQDSITLQKITLTVSELSDFLKLGEFLRDLLRVQILTLVIMDDDNVEFSPKSVRNLSLRPPVLRNVKQLHLDIKSSCSSRVTRVRNYQNLLDGLLWICHPESMVLTSESRYNKELMFKLLRSKLQGLPRTRCCKFSRVKCWMHDLPRTRCCRSSRVKCWMHDVRGAEIKIIEADGISSSKILTSDLPILKPDQKICFSFMWC